MGNVKISKYLPAVAYSLLLFFLFRSALSWLIFHDWKRGDFNYCFLMPAIVLYLIWEKREILNKIESVNSFRGFIPLMLGVFIFWLGELAGEFFTQYLSLWLFIVGLVWIHFGWKKLKKIIFPLALLLAMFPPPQFLTHRLTLKLKLLSSQLGVWLMQMWGMSAYREGNIIDLGFTRLQVVAACMSLPPTASILCFTFLGSQLR